MSTGSDRSVQLKGRITQASLDEVGKQLAEWLESPSPVPPAYVDLGETDFVDSSGLSWLLVWHKRYAMAGSRLIIHSVPATVKDVLRMMRLDMVLDLAVDQESAEASARGGVS
ncbi:MAG: STAS domain-containing protein [Planctomycetota bacterium]